LSISEKDVLIVCAGWKGKVNLEDTLFAGALADALEYTTSCDAPLVAIHSYRSMHAELNKHVRGSSHAQRLKRLDIDKDIDYCLQFDLFDIVPELVDGALTRTANDQA
jgi:2-phosphosulfolactate phosphatase